MFAEVRGDPVGLGVEFVSCLSVFCLLLHIFR